jgi:hypothetical protein
LEFDQTLLDADIVLFQPGLGDYDLDYLDKFNGKSILTHESSFTTKKCLDHWRTEIIAAVDAGKLVIVYLVKPVEYCRHTGKQEHSGTGRSRVTTNIVVDVSSYESIPVIEKIIPKSGSEIRLEKGATYLASYWIEFAEFSPYEVEIEGKFSSILLASRMGKRTVGAAVDDKSGTLLFLPPLRYDEDLFTRDAKEGENEEATYWTQDALRFGKRLVRALVSLDDARKRLTQITPTPSWALSSDYRLSLEVKLEASITTCAAEIAEMQAKKSKLEEQLEDAGGLRRLLFEQGKPLEQAILEAMRLFGFEACAFSDGESEFDAVFVSQEGRCLGEAEGKDNKPINIDKLSQLERNLQEDFARDEVTQYAKGVLFGNAYRLVPLDDRGDFFTQKCVSGAKRAGVALVRTPDLFGSARHIKENASDVEYAKQCREAIFSSSGEVVTFPPPPVRDRVPLTEKARQEGEAA